MILISIGCLAMLQFSWYKCSDTPILPMLRIMKTSDYLKVEKLILKIPWSELYHATLSQKKQITI